MLPTQQSGEDLALHLGQGGILGEHPSVFVWLKVTDQAATTEGGRLLLNESVTTATAVQDQAHDHLVVLALSLIGPKALPPHCFVH